MARLLNYRNKALDELLAAVARGTAVSGGLHEPR